MTASIENLDGLQRRLTLNLDSAAIESEVTKRLQKLARSIKLDGFRPGKAPIKVVAARHGGEIRGEVIGDALQDGFFKAVDEHKIDVAGYPSFSQADGEALAFHATFEVYPEITVGDLGQIKVSRPVVEVTDADVDRTLDVLRKQRMHYENADRAAQDKDRVHVDYVGKIDGEVFEGGEAKGFPVVLGEGRTLPEFEGAMSGMKAGESKTFTVTFPEDYFAKNLAGKTAEFTVDMKSVQEPVLPELDEAFAASMGISEGGAAKLREEVAGNLGREAKRRIQSKVKEQVMDGLLAACPFDVPASLVGRESQSMLSRAVSDLKARGMREQDIKMNTSLFEPQAKRRVALGLLLNTLAETNEIKAGEDQVRGMVEEFAHSYEDPSEVVSWYYKDAERLREVESLALEENIVNWVLERAQVSDESTTLEALMGKA